MVKHSRRLRVSRVVRNARGPYPRLPFKRNDFSTLHEANCEERKPGHHAAHLLCVLDSNGKNVRGMKRTTKPVLEISGLWVRRGRTTILRDVSWRVERGQHWVVLGANGSGKTSLLSALTGYLTPSAGGIAVLGHRYGETDWRELRKRIGLVSSSVRQMMPEDEPALDTLISGKYAMIDFWGRATRADRARAMRILRRI